MYAGAKSPGVDRESNWLPASGPFSLYIRAYWAGSPSSMVSGDRRLSSEYNEAGYRGRDTFSVQATGKSPTSSGTSVTTINATLQ
jgi:hypothetical protein